LEKRMQFFWLVVLCAAMLAGEVVTAAWAESSPFPELDLEASCAAWASKQPYGPAVDPAVLAEQCVEAQLANKREIRVLWDAAPEAVRRGCSASATARESYAALGLCLLNHARR
jgi:hypothetical protein